MNASMFFARIWAAFLYIGRLGAKPVGYVSGIVRRVASVGFVTKLAPVVFKALRSYGGVAAALISLWYGFRGELLSVDDALKIAKEKGLDEIIQSRNETEVLRQFIAAIPGVNEESKRIFEKAFVDGIPSAQQEANKAKQGVSPLVPVAAAPGIEPRPPIKAGSPDAVIEQTLATAPGIRVDLRNTNAGGPIVGKSAYQLFKEFDAFKQLFENKHGLSFEDFVRDLQRGYSLYSVVEKTKIQSV